MSVLLGFKIVPTVCILTMVKTEQIFLLTSDWRLVERLLSFLYPQLLLWSLVGLLRGQLWGCWLTWRPAPLLRDLSLSVTYGQGASLVGRHEWVTCPRNDIVQHNICNVSLSGFMGSTDFKEDGASILILILWPYPRNISDYKQTKGNRRSRMKHKRQYDISREGCCHYGSFFWQHGA
jgi:hypothetical protein